MVSLAAWTLLLATVEELVSPAPLLFLGLEDERRLNSFVGLLLYLIEQLKFWVSQMQPVDQEG